MKNSLVIALWLCLCSWGWSQPMTLPGYTWDPPIPFGEVQELGPDAVFALYPADAKPDQARFELVVVHTPRDSIAMMREGGADPKSLALVTFFGLSGRPEQINKTLFMGGTEARLVYRGSIPRPHILHLYQKYLEDDALVTVGLRDFGGGDPSLTAEVLRGLAETFRPTFHSEP